MERFPRGMRQKRGARNGRFGMAEEPANKGLGSITRKRNIIITAKLLSYHCGTGTMKYYEVRLSFSSYKRGNRNTAELNNGPNFT